MPRKFMTVLECSKVNCKSDPVNLLASKMVQF